VKTRNWMKLGISALALAAVTPTFAQGIINKVNDRGTNASSRWCTDALRTLDLARRDADVAYYRGDLMTAKGHLMNGLERSQAGNNFRNAGPLTARAIARGIVLAREIDAATQAELNGARTTVYFLFRYYDFVAIVADRLDYPFYIPFTNCRGCRLAEEAIFEHRFLDYTKEQVQLVMDSLTESTGDLRRGAVFPIGAPEAFLHALELSSTYASQDLRESLWASRYACQIDSLNQLASRLASGAYLDEVDAVNSAYLMARDILEEIQPGKGCGRR